MSELNIEEMLAGETFITEDAPKQMEVKDPEIIRFRVGDVIVGRFLPRQEDLTKSKVEYTDTGINSQLTGEYVRCGKMRKLEGLADPFQDLRKRVWAKFEETKDETFREFYRNCFQVSPKALFNWFTISHTNDKVDDFEEREFENNVLRLPANKNWKTGEITSHVLSKWHKAYYGDGPDDEDKLGNAVFDLSKNGYSFKFKIVDKGGFINYDQSDFEMKPKAIKGLGDKWQDPYFHTFDLEQYVPLVMTEEEVREILNTHLEEVVNACNGGRTISLGGALADNDDIPLGDEESDVDAESEEKIQATIESFRQKQSAKAAS